MSDPHPGYDDVTVGEMARRAILGQLHLSHRYAHFETTITFHELLNVPYLDGEFGVSWLIKHSVPGQRRANGALESVQEQHSDGEGEKTRTRTNTLSSASTDQILSAPVELHGENDHAPSITLASPTMPTRTADSEPVPGSENHISNWDVLIDKVMAGSKKTEQPNPAPPEPVVDHLLHVDAPDPMPTVDPLHLQCIEGENGTEPVHTAEPSTRHRSHTGPSTKSSTSIPTSPESGTRLFFGDELVVSPNQSTLSLDKLRIDTNVHEETPAPAPSVSAKRRPHARALPSSSGSSTPTSTASLVPHRPVHGKSPNVPVENYAVKWDEAVHSIVRIRIGRQPSESLADAGGKDTESVRSMRQDAGAGRLRSSTMRLQITRQYTLPNGTTEHARFGTLTLDLAEYAPIVSASTPMTRSESRQYMLDHCSCNALLRMTIEMKLIDTTHMYRVPPIHKGIVAPASLSQSEKNAHSSALMQRRSQDEEGQASSPTPLPINKDHQLGMGLEWHFKLPLPLLFHSTVVPSAHLKPRQSHEPGAMRGGGSLAHALSNDASQPRHAYCRMNSEALIDELFNGLLGPSVDQRNEGDVNLPKPNKTARLRWKRLIHAVTQNPRRAYSGNDVPPTRPRRRADSFRRVPPLPPLHVRFGRTDAQDEAPLTS
ncbi:hypothetical protein Malapachy_1115 [Malassezia pachydermatis]|uniref:C2 NT-type domain-containing protein n=1 Tax=Malassezia pachydermatis TaxID=77020 RepID=A0A0M8MML8_9BASI|nr:hypothetical protein Malapachy_1115 [Malassezia pachydermatis]KOS14618.1 hypothetical protein Malapachy_1115 [Malassezia pachydermatis]